MTDRMMVGKEIADAAAKIMGLPDGKLSCEENPGDNGTDGIAVRAFAMGGVPAVTIINIDDLIDGVIAGKLTKEEAAEELAGKLEAIGDPAFGVGRLSRETILAECRVKLMNAKANAKAMERRPYRLNCDLVEFVILPVYRGKLKGVIHVDDGMMEAYGIGEEELFAAALRNTAKTAVLSDMSGLTDAGDDGAGLWLLTNRDCVYGAGIAACPEVLIACRDRMGGDIFIIPSSVHEILLCRKTSGDRDEAGEMTKLVKEVNVTLVHDDEILSDHVYGITEDGRLRIEA